MPINAAIVIFSGFTERSSSQGNGTADLYDRCADEFAGRGVRVLYHPWDADTQDIAFHLWDRHGRERRLRLAIVGYSYGGNAAVRLCNHLVRCGIEEIDLLGLIDPVVRWDWLPGFAAALGAGSFSVPCQVRNLMHVRQTAPRWSVRRAMQGGDLFDPAGHTVWTCPPTDRHDVSATAGHRRIDESVYVQGGFVERIRGMLAAPEATK